MRKPVWLIALLATGCGGDARLEFASSDALHALAREMERTVREYHTSIESQDSARETAVVDAFIARVLNDRNDEATLRTHADAFETALGKVRTDRSVEQRRYMAAMDNVSLLRETAAGLQRVAVESLTLQDEMRRYLDRWIDQQRATQSGAPVDGGE